MKKFISIITGLLLLGTTVYAAPPLTYERTLIPEIDNSYDIGTSTQAWRDGYFNSLCFSATSCIERWITQSTGLISTQGDISTTSDTAVQVPALTGQVVDHSDPENPIIYPVSIATTTVEIDNIATQFLTFLSVDKDGNIIQTAARPTGTQLREAFIVGGIGHFDLATINVVDSIARGPISNVALSLADLSVALGSLQVKLKEIEMSANGANLQIDFSSSTHYISGENWFNDNESPNIFEKGPIEPITFFYTWTDGAGGYVVATSTSSHIIPGAFDDGTGGAAADGPNGTVGDEEFTNQYVFYVPATDGIFIQYGQTKYTSVIGALLGRESEFRETSDIDPENEAEIFVGFITVRGDATDLSDSTQANFGSFQEVDRFYDDLANFGDGLFYNKDIVITETSGNGSTTVEIDTSSGDDLIIQLNGQSFNLATDSVDNKVTLTAGTDTVPVKNYVYAVRSGSKAVLQQSTTEPTVDGVGLYANVKVYVMPSEATTEADGFYSSQQILDRFGDVNQSHMRHIDEVLRENANWLSGVVPTFTRNVSATTTDDIFVSLTSGVVRQLHKHDWTAFVDGEAMYIANDFTTPFEKVNNFNQVTEDTSGNNLHVNNRRFNLVIWGAQDEDGSDRKLFVNAPTGSYLNDADAVVDINKTAVQSIPDDFKGTGFLIARIVLKYTNVSNGTLEIIQINGADFEDLRGISGAGGGATSVAQNDFSDALFSIFNSVDSTKIGTYDLSGITTGNTRTVNWLDTDGTMVLSDTILTTGSIPFVNSLTQLDEDNPNLFWDDTNDRLGIGTTSPYAKLSVVGETVSEYFTATSTTATSTFAGILSVGSSTPDGSALFEVGTSTPLFFVNKNNGRVGVGTANPASQLAIYALTTTAQIEMKDVGLATGAWFIGVNSSNGGFLFSQAGTAGNQFTIDDSTGLMTAGNSSTPGGLTVYGPGIFNEVGGDNDFRVEGDTDTHALFVEGSSDKVGVSTTSPFAKFSVHHGAGEIPFAVGSSTKTSVAIDKDGRVGIGTSNPTSQFAVYGSLAQIEMKDTDLATGAWFMGVNSATGGFLFSQAGTAGNQFTIDDSTGVLTAGNSSTPGGLTVYGGGIINEVGGDNDFRVEGDTDTHLLFADAGTDRVGIGTTTPGGKLSVEGAVIADSFDEYSPMYIGSKATTTLKDITFLPGTENGNWADIDHSTVGDGITRTETIEYEYDDGLGGTTTSSYEIDLLNIGKLQKKILKTVQDLIDDVEEIRNGGHLRPNATPPASPKSGQMWFNSAGSEAVCIYVSGGWEKVAGDGNCITP